MTTADDLDVVHRWAAAEQQSDHRLLDELLADQFVGFRTAGFVPTRAQIVASMRGIPWRSFEQSEERLLAVDESVAVVAYRAIARRDGADYRALFQHDIHAHPQPVAHPASPTDAA
jgi:Domain of unknown function (DUF4440)